MPACVASSGGSASTAAGTVLAALFSTTSVTEVSWVAKKNSLALAVMVMSSPTAGV